MPELPEIEIVKRSLFKTIHMAKIIDIKIVNKNLRYKVPKFFSKNLLDNKEIELWPAIIGTEVNISEYQKKGFLTKDFKMNLAGSLGCYLSHVTLWENCVKDKHCNIALIFEDDAIIKNDFNLKISEIEENELPEDWTILKLSYKGLQGTPI